MIGDLCHQERYRLPEWNFQTAQNASLMNADPVISDKHIHDMRIYLLDLAANALDDLLWMATTQETLT